VLLYLLGLAGEILLLTSVYMVMPVGRLWWRHALVGGVTAALLWELTRTGAGLVLRHAVAGERGLRLADHRHRRAVQPGDRRHLLLLGAQVISEYERMGTARQDQPAKPMRLG
jgi:hypothetical protein